MSIVKIQIQDADGNIIHPETTSSVVKVNSETLDSKLANIDKSITDEINRAKQKESELTNGVLNVYTKAQTFTKDEINKKITDLIGNSPDGLNTLEEIAKSINNDINFAGTMSNELNKKSNNGHTHDDRYYTEAEANSKLDTKFNKTGGSITGDVSISGKVTINGTAKDNPLNIRGINGIINNEDGSINDSELYLNYNTTNPVFINGTNKVYHQGFKPTKSDIGLANVTNESKSTMFTSPVFTGIPIVPTAANGTNNTQIASTAFIHSLLAEYGLDSKAVTASGDWNNYVKTGFYNGSGLTNAPTGLNGMHTWFYVIVITHSNSSDYVCQIAIDFNNVGMFKRVRNSGTWNSWSRIYSTTDKPNKSDVGLSNVTNESKTTMFTSPIFTGVPTAPTAANGTNNTQLATTAFVTNAINNKTSVSGNAATASKLATARNINGVSFDGSKDITIADNTKLPLAGGNMSGVININKQGLGIKISNGTSRTMMFSSSTLGEHIFGGNNDSSDDPVDYIRIGPNKLLFNTFNTAYSIYHEGNKPTKSDIGLGSVENTSDLGKPISTATQNALDTKLNRSGGSMSGTISWDGLTANKDLLYATGSTDWAKIQYIINSPDNCEFRNQIGDDTSTKFTWYGNSTNLMTLQPTGNGTTISGADLSINGNITATNFNGTVNGFTLGKTVPANAVFTDTNTWRGVQDNLTSTATDQSLSANQGKVLKGLVDGKASTSHTHNNIVSRGVVNAETGTGGIAVGGLSMSQAYNGTSHPANYGNVLNLNGAGQGQLLIGWSGTSGGYASSFIRSKRDTNDAPWSSWAKIYTTLDKPSPSEIGLGNVDNTSDINKPISTATQNALNGKANSSHTHNYAGSSSAGGSATTALACTGNSATATKLATARTISLIGAITGSGNFDGSGNLTINTSNLKSYSFNNVAYMKLFTFTVTANYVNTPINFDLIGRNSNSNQTRFTIKLNNENNVTPLISAFTYTGDNQYGSNAKLYKLTSTGSTYEMWIKQGEGYDAISIFNMFVPAGISIVYNGTTATALPTGMAIDKSCTLGTAKQNIDGNASTATRATQDSDGKQINTTYVKKGMTWNDLEGV